MRKPQAAAPLAALREAAIPGEVIPGAAIRAEVIRAEAIPGAVIRAEAVGEVIPQGDNKTPARALKTTPKCSR
jgi:hypothetical protein